MLRAIIVSPDQELGDRLEDLLRAARVKHFETPGMGIY